MLLSADGLALLAVSGESTPDECATADTGAIVVPADIRDSLGSQDSAVREPTADDIFDVEGEAQVSEVASTLPRRFGESDRDDSGLSSTTSLFVGSSTLTDQLVETLRTANGPPEVDALVSVGPAVAPDVQTPLTDGQLAPIFQAAKDLWAKFAPDPSALAGITISISNLADNQLGTATGNAITIDTTAAGYGWFVDATPTDASEFADPQNLPAGMDLLTVVLHEIGHTLGYGHGTIGYEALMSATLATGVRNVPAASSLNGVINALLAGFNQGTPPSGAAAEFTSADLEIPNVLAVGETLGGGVDLELKNVTLKFAGLSFGGVAWSGQVSVEAIGGTLFAGLLDIAVIDRTNDLDPFAVAGVINLAFQTASSLKLDDLDGAGLGRLGWPSFLDVEITNLSLDFTNFRGNEKLNSLALAVQFTGLDSGDETINSLISADNPLFGLSVEGSAEVDLALTSIEAAVAADPNPDNVGKMEAALEAAVKNGIDDIDGKISGHLGGWSLTAGMIVNTVTFDPDGAGPMPTVVVTYLAVEGSIGIGGKDYGQGFNLGVAFAISDLGPLQFFFSAGQFPKPKPTSPDLPKPKADVPGSLVLESFRGGVRFNASIEDLQTFEDPDDITEILEESGRFLFDASGVAVAPAAPGYRVTLTLSGHDIAIGNNIRVRGAANDKFNGDFTVLTVNGDDVTYEVATNPGIFAGSAQVIRLTITNPLDLRRDGLSSGVAPPESIFAWRDQLDQAVMDQIEDIGSDPSWGDILKDMVFGGGATVSISPISDARLRFEADFMIDGRGHALVIGNAVLLDGLVNLPTSLYVDFSDLLSGNLSILYLSDVPEFSNGIFDPLLTLRGAATFETLAGSDILGATVTENVGAGFWEVRVELALDSPSAEYTVGDNAVIFGAANLDFDGPFEVIAVSDATNTITIKRDTNPGAWAGGGTPKVANENALDGDYRLTMEGGVDVHIPGVTTLTLDGSTQIEFKLPGAGPDELLIELSFDSTLSETNVGTIGFASGNFHVTLDTDVAVDLDHPVGGAKIWGAALLTTNFGFLEPVGLFAEASALLRINSTAEPKPDEILMDVNDNPVAIELPARSFALRVDGTLDFRIDFNNNDTFSESESIFLIDGTFVLEFSADQGFNVAVFREVGGSILPATLRIGNPDDPMMTFEVFGFLAVRSNGVAANLLLSLQGSFGGGVGSLVELSGQFVFIVNTTGEDITFFIPGGATDPNRPNGLSVTIPRAAPTSPSAVAEASFESLINGQAWTVSPATVGAPYALLFIKGELELLSAITLDVSGFVLLSPSIVTIEIKVAGNFLDLVSVSGSAFISSEGEFEFIVDGSVQLGPDGFNVSGSAHLEVSYLDSNGKSSGGTGTKSLKILGSVTASAEIFYIPLPAFTVSVFYDSGTGEISISVGPVPVPFIDYYTASTWFGTVRIPFPNVKLKSYTFTIGTLALTPPANPVVLGQVNGSGVLTLNVGSSAKRTLRNLVVDEIDEEVLLDRVGPGSQTGDKIRVTMFGVTQTFDNVANILIADMDAGDDSVQISNRVTIPVEAHLGAGNDTLISAGSGVVKAWGDGGADRLTGGSGVDELYGGTGADILRGGKGADRVEGGDDSDVLIWAVGDGVDTVFDGQAGADSLNILGADSPEQFTVNGSGANFTVTIDGVLLTAVGIEDATLQGNRGADVFTLNDLGASVLKEINIELGDDSVPDSAVINGTGSTETFVLSTGVVTRQVVDNEGNATPVEVEGLRIAKTGGVAVTIFDSGNGSGADTIGLNAAGGADTISVLGTPAGTMTTVNGGVGSDVFAIGASNGTLNDIDGLLILIGGDGDTDSLTVSDAGDSIAGETPGVLTATQITGLGMAAGLTYGGMEALGINLGSAADHLTIQGTAPGFTTVVNGGNGDDRFYIRSVPNALTVNGGAGADRFHVSSLAANGVDPFSAAAGTLTKITAQLTIDTGAGGGSRDEIYLSAAGSPSALIDGVLTTNSLTGLGHSVPISFITPAGTDIHIGLGSGNDVFRVRSVESGDRVFVHGGAGNDTLNIGNISNVLTDIDGSVTFVGDGNSDTLNIYGDGSTDAGLLTASQITGLGLAPGTAIIYAPTAANSTVESLHVRLGPGNDTFSIDSTNPSVTTTIHGGGGADTFNVGSTTGNLDRLDRISGALVLDGETGSDTITLNNSGTTVAGTGTLLGDIVSGLSNSGPITLASAESINVLMGTGDDNFYVPSLAAGLSVLLKMGVGEDTVFVGTGNSATPGNIGAILGALQVDGGGGGLDRLFLDDRATVAAQTWTVTNDPNFATPPGRPWPLDLTSVARSGAATVTYFNTEAVVLNAGSGADTILLHATHREQDEIGGKSSSFTVNGGNGADTVVLGLPVLGGSVMGGFAVDEGAPTVGSPKGIAVFINGGDGADKIEYDNSAGTLAGTEAIFTRTFESIFPADPATNPASANPAQVEFYTGLFGSDPTGTTFESLVLGETGIAASVYVYTRGMEAVQLSLGGAGDTLQVQTGQYVTSLSVGGGAGEDSFRIENGADFQGHAVILNGGADDDLLFIDFSMASIVDAGDLVQTVLEVSAENAPVASGLTELAAGDHYIETQLSGPDWQFRLVDDSGTPVLVAAAAGGAATSDWQNIADIGGALLFDTQRGLLIQFTGDELLYQAGSKGAGTGAQILMGAPSGTFALTFNGGSGSSEGDTLRIAGDGDTTGGEYQPDALVPNAGVVTLRGNTIAFTGVEPLVVHGLPDFLVITPDDPANIVIGSAAVAGLNLDVLALHVLTVDGVVSWTQPEQLGAFEPLGETRQFAGAMAITPDGSTMVIGAQRILDGVAMASGVVFVYNWDTATARWVEVAKLYAPDADATVGYGNEFGYSVAIDAAKTIVIGAPGNGESLQGFIAQPQFGAAYVYTPKDGGWSFQKKLLLPPGWQKFDRLGASVAVDGATVMVSSTGNLGDVYFFERGGPLWDDVTVSIGFGITGVGYGSKVAILGDTAVVTQPDWPAAWVFLRAGDQWESNPANFLQVPNVDHTTQYFEPYTDTNKNGKWDPGEPWDDRSFDPGAPLFTLPGNDNGRYDNPSFGRSVAMTSIGGGQIRIAMGAPGWNEGGLDANYQTGRVYMFEGSERNWTLTATLTAAEGVTGDRFGESVALSGNYLVVGAPGVDHSGVVDAGATYLFEKGVSWTRSIGPAGATDRMTAATPNGGGGDRGVADRFGESVVMGGGRIVAGMPGFDETSGPTVLRADAGAVRTFRLEERVLADVNVRFNIPHAWVSDIRVVLRAPDNSSITLLQAIGGSGDNFTNTILDDEAAIAITSGGPPYNGTYRPQFTALSFFDGKAVLGNWSLEVTDLSSSVFVDDSGSLSSWSLTFTFTDGSSAFYSATSGLGAIPDPGTRPSTISTPLWAPAPISLLVPAAIGTAKTGASVAIDGNTAAVGAPDYDNRGAVFIYERKDANVVADLNVTVTHAAAVTSNLEVTLIGPSGTEVILIAGLFNIGGSSSPQTTILDDEAEYWILDVNPFINDPDIPGNYIGELQPLQSLEAFDGESITGEWTLRVVDTTAVGGPGSGLVGKIDDWALEFTLADGSVLTYSSNTPQIIPKRNSGTAEIVPLNLQATMDPPELFFWDLTATIQPDGIRTGDEFGFSVGLSDGVLVVGAPGDSGNGSTANAGTFYVFQRVGDDWSFQKGATVGSAGWRLGEAVDVFGDTLVVGAPGFDNGPTADVGIAFAFERDGLIWTQSGQFFSNGGASAGFGSSIAMDANHVVVGAPGYDGQGAAVVWARTLAGFDFIEVLKAGDGQAGDRFGESVGVSNGRLVAGAPGVGADVGAAYAYSWNGATWDPTMVNVAGVESSHLELGASSGNNDFFGHAVAIDGQRIVVGAHGRDHTFNAGTPSEETRTDSGQAFAFGLKGGVWTLETLADEPLFGPGAGAGDQVGYAVAISGDNAVLGAPQLGGRLDASDDTDGNGYVWLRTVSPPTTIISVETQTVLIGGAMANTIEGTVGLGHVETAQLRFFDIKNVTLRTGSGDDTIALAADGLVAYGLVNFTVETGAGDDTLTLLGNQLIPPAAKEQFLLGGDQGASDYEALIGFFTFDGGAGKDTIATNADGGWTLELARLVASGGGPLSLIGVESANLTGGSGPNFFAVRGWLGTVQLDGAGGSDSYELFVTAGKHIAISDTGGSGIDYLVVNGTSLADSIFVDVDQLGIGSSTVSYAGIETLLVAGGEGDDYFRVKGSSAESVELQGQNGKDVYSIADGATASAVPGGGADPHGGGAATEALETLANNALVALSIRDEGENETDVDLLLAPVGAVIVEIDPLSFKYTMGGVDIIQFDRSIEAFSGTPTNTAPDFTVAAGQVADEGASTLFSIGSFSDPVPSGTWTVTVDWGDGTAATVFANELGAITAKSHTYAQDGSYTVLVTIQKDAIASLASARAFQVDVANVAPDLQGVALTSATIDEGGVAVLNGQIIDPGTEDSFLLSIEWGDQAPGSPELIVLSAAAVLPANVSFNPVTRLFSVTHRYLENNIPGVQDTNAIAVTVSDEKGASDSGATAITVNDLAPTAVITGDSALFEGDTGGFNASASTSSPDAIVSYEWDLDNDGAFDDATGLTASRVFLQNGNFTVRLRVTDEDGSTNTTTLVVTVTDQVPVAVVSGDADLVEGATGNFDASGSTSETDTIVTYEWDWNYNGSSFAASGNTGVSQSHIFADNGAFTVAMRVTDSDGSSAVVTMVVTVANVAPTIALSGSASVNEGSVYTLTLGAVTDPGSDTVSSYVVHWGDGSTSSYGTPGNKTHTYADGAAQRSITVDLVDEDGTHLVAGSLNVSVLNVAPTVTLSGAATVAEGSSYTLTLSNLVDPGADTVSAISIDWGDGTTTVGALGANAHTYADDGVYAISVTLTDEDGTHGFNASVQVTNIAPTIALSGAATAGEGTPYTLTLGVVTDPGDDAVTDFIVHWGDGTTDTYRADGAVAHVYADNGISPTIVVDLLDRDGSYLSVATLSLTVLNVAPAISVNPVSQGVQYSDPIQTLAFTASDVPTDTVSLAATHFSLNGGAFQSGLPSGLTLTTVVAGVGGGSWTVHGNANVAPGSYVVRLTVVDEDGGSSSVGGTLSVAKDDAVASYSGSRLVATSSGTSGTAVVELRATLIELLDLFPGNISLATVSFIDVTNPGAPVTIASGLPVAPIDPADSRLGTAAYSWHVDIGNQDSVTFKIQVRVDGRYTFVPVAGDSATVSVSKAANQSVTGAGRFTNSLPAGSFAPDVGVQTEYGFSLKTNQKGTNVRADVLIRLTQVGRTYEIRTNNSVSIVLDPADPARTEFTAAASLVDVTDPSTPVLIAGNLQLIGIVADLGEGGVGDLVGFSLWNGNVLLYASNWNGARAVAQPISEGDNSSRFGPANLRLGGPAPAAGSVAAVLTTAQLEAVVEAAAFHPPRFGDDPGLRSVLQQIEFRITDLSGDRLGAALGRVVWIDHNAAGRGWSLEADGSSSGDGRVDLLSVVAHEFGHVIGLGHDVLGVQLGVSERLTFELSRGAQNIADSPEPETVSQDEVSYGAETPTRDEPPAALRPPVIWGSYVTSLVGAHPFDLGFSTSASALPDRPESPSGFGESPDFEELLFRHLLREFRANPSIFDEEGADQ